MLDKPRASTSWTPVRGAVIEWKFVWLNEKARLKNRPCVILDTPAEISKDVMIVLLANPEMECSSRASEIRWWDKVDGDVRVSNVYPHRLEFNLVPVEVVSAFVGGNKEAWVAGDMDDAMCRSVDRNFYGSLKSGVVNLMPGMRWLGDNHYMPLRLTVDGDKAFRLEESGEPIKRR